MRPVKGEPVGIYRLQDIDRVDLPVEIHRGPWYDPVNSHIYNQLVLRVTDGAMTLHDDKTFSYRFDVTVEPDTQTQQFAVFEVNGTWDAQGSDVIVHLDGQEPKRLAIQKSGIVVSFDLMANGDPRSFRFRKGRRP